MDFIRRFRGNVPHHDQGIINAVCHNKVHILSLRYNVNSIFIPILQGQLADYTTWIFL